MIVVKPSKETFAITLVAISLCVVGLIPLYRVSNSLILCFFMLLFLLLLVTLSLYIEARTLVMDKDGCTVKFLCFKKTYKWQELKTVRVESFDGCFQDKTSYIKGVIFSPKANLRPFRWVKPLSNIWRNHFDFFFVYFRTIKEENSVGIRYYEVDEAEFMEKLAEWGVEVKVLTNREKYIKS